jgi:hypothetical protein
MQPRVRNLIVFAVLALAMAGGMVAVAMTEGRPPLSEVAARWYIFAGLGSAALLQWSALSRTRPAPAAGAEERDAALGFAPPPPMLAALYVWRPGNRRTGSVGLDVALDGHGVAQLRGGEFVRLDMPPGTRRLSAAMSGGVGFLPVEREVELRGGSVTVLRLGTKMGLASTQLTIEEVAAREARNGLRRAAMVRPFG